MATLSIKYGCRRTHLSSCSLGIDVVETTMYAPASLQIAVKSFVLVFSSMSVDLHIGISFYHTLLN